MLEYTISKPGTGVIDYQTMDVTPQSFNSYVLSGATGLTASISFVGCTKGLGGSLEDGRGFSYNFYTIRGSGSNASGTATSNQTLGVRYPSAC
jgi:hypothetical protein